MLCVGLHNILDLSLAVGLYQTIHTCDVSPARHCLNNERFIKNFLIILPAVSSTFSFHNNNVYSIRCRIQRARMCTRMCDVVSWQQLTRWYFSLIKFFASIFPLTHTIRPAAAEKM